MPSTYTKLHYHLVFSTYRREHMICEEWENRLYAYLIGCLRQADCHPIEIGGYTDHMHILVGMKPTHRVCDVLCDIKSSSSKWIHDTIGDAHFRWQEGYGAFTTSAKEDRELRHYIRTQKEHHRSRTFVEEYKAMLRDAGVDWDPRFLS